MQLPHLERSHDYADLPFDKKADRRLQLWGAILLLSRAGLRIFNGPFLTS